MNLKSHINNRVRFFEVDCAYDLEYVDMEEIIKIIIEYSKDECWNDNLLTELIKEEKFILLRVKQENK